MRYLKWFIAAVVVLFPVLALTVRGAANIIFYMVAISGVAGIIYQCRTPGKGFGSLVRDHWVINLAMAGVFLSVLANQLFTGQYVLKNFDSPWRMALFGLIFYAFLKVPVRYVKRLELGLIAGALLCAIKMYLITAGGTDRENAGNFIPIIAYAEMALLLGFFSVLSIGWNGKNERTLIFLKIVAGCAGLYGVYLSKTRGAWLAIPVFFMVILWAYKGKLIHKIYIFMLSIFLIAGMCYFTQDRVTEAQNDIAQYVSGTNTDTSVGIRFQLWRGSLLLFAEHPIAGVGREGFKDSLNDLVGKNVISAEAAKYPHSHAEIIYNMATLGILGLFATLALYFVPAYLFWKEMNNQAGDVRCVAGMGVVLCLGYFVFGLVDVLFMWGICNTFYVFFLAVFFAYIEKRKGMECGVFKNDVSPA